MTFFDRIKQYFKRGMSLTDPKAWDQSLWNLIGSQSLSGEKVTESTALTYSAVWCAVNLISGTIASLPLHLMQRKGERKRLADDRLMYQVMHDQANPYMTALVCREVLMAHVLTWGNGYAEIVRNGYGEVMELWPVPPHRVKPEMRAGGLVYRVRLDQHPEVILPADKMLHVHGLGYDGFVGYSPVSIARKSLGLGMAMETFGARYFGNGTHLGAIVSHPGKLSQQAHDNLQTSLVNAYSGLGNTHKLLLLEEGMSVQKYGIPPNDSQFLESRQFQIPEVARWFNLPPHKLKDLTRSSFSNIESEQISFVTDSILPWLVRLEAAYNTQLLTAGDRGDYGRGRLYYKHSVEGLLRGDNASRASFYQTMWNIGAMSVNEIREKEDLDPVAGGDEHFVPMNMQTLVQAGREKPAPQVVKVQDAEGDEGDGKAKGGNGADKDAAAVPAG